MNTMEKIKRQIQRRERAIDYASRAYANPSDDDIEIDDSPQVLEAEEGMWVAAWLWVPNSELEKDQ